MRGRGTAYTRLATRRMPDARRPHCLTCPGCRLLGQSELRIVNITPFRRPIGGDKRFSAIAFPRQRSEKIECFALLVTFCLYGCFRRPQAVVYARASPAVSEDIARIPGEIRHRRSLPTVFGCLSLAGWFRLSSMWAAPSVRSGATTTVGVRQLSASGFGDSRNDPA